MQTAQIVRATDHGPIVQVLCADDRGLLSVYFEHKPFSLLYKALRKAGLNLEGLQIRYDRNRVYVLALDKTWISHNT